VQAMACRCRGTCSAEARATHYMWSASWIERFELRMCIGSDYCHGIYFTFLSKEYLGFAGMRMNSVVRLHVGGDHASLGLKMGSLR
jgi:hypothetical protein